jgi:ribosomal protein S18 acetylase RimI-like enzyme
MEIRQMRIMDIEAVHRLGSETKEFQVSESTTFWPIDMLGTWICAGQDVLLVAEEDGQIAGFFLSQLHQPTGKAIIENCMVAKNFRGLGIAEKLFKAGFELLKEKNARYVCAEVHPDNLAIQHILAKSIGLEKGENFTWMGVFVN